MECVFSAPGFKDFMQAGSVCEGERNELMPEGGDAASRKKNAHVVIYKQP
jgi:hypothetical protein